MHKLLDLKHLQDRVTTESLSESTKVTKLPKTPQKSPYGTQHTSDSIHNRKYHAARPPKYKGRLDRRCRGPTGFPCYLWSYLERRPNDDIGSHNGHCPWNTPHGTRSHKYNTSPTIRRTNQRNYFRKGDYWVDVDMRAVLEQRMRPFIKECATDRHIQIARELADVGLLHQRVAADTTDRIHGRFIQLERSLQQRLQTQTADRGTVRRVEHLQPGEHHAGQLLGGQSLFEDLI